MLSKWASWERSCIKSSLYFMCTISEVPDEVPVEESSTPKRSRFNLQSRDGRTEEEEEEEEEGSVRRSSRITRYKLHSHNQSVLYDRLITKWVQHFLSKTLQDFKTSSINIMIQIQRWTFTKIDIFYLWLSARLKLFCRKWMTCKRWDVDWEAETLKKR